MNEVCNELENIIASSCKSGACRAPYTMNIYVVIKAFLILKPDKSNGMKNVSFDTLNNGYYGLYVHLA